MTTGTYGSRILMLTVLALSGSGAWLSGEMVKSHANLWKTGAAPAGLFASMCVAGENAGFSCEQATHGPWSTIAIPIPVLSEKFSLSSRRVKFPVAFAGLAYFVFMGVWFACLGAPRSHGRRWHLIPLIVGICGGGVSLLFIAVMASGAAPWCVGCLAIHAVNALMIAAVWRICRPPHDATVFDATNGLHPEQWAQHVLTPQEVVNVMGFALILIAGFWLYRGERIAIQKRIDKLLPDRALVNALRDDPSFLLREHRTQPVHSIPRRAEEPAGGGMARLVMFTDFECPSCFCKVQEVHGEIREAFGGRLDVRIRHYPLCNTCNDQVPTEFHRNACDAAYAAEAARLLGGENALAAMSHQLYRNRKKLNPDIYPELAAKIGLDERQFAEAFQSDAVRDMVRADIALANRLGVTGTPALFLNGRRVTTLCQTPTFWETVAQNPDLWDDDARLASAPKAEGR